MPDRYLVLRTPSGISGDMLLTGLARLAGLDNDDLSRPWSTVLVSKHCTVALHLEQTSVNNISGWKATVTIPPRSMLIAAWLISAS